MSIKPVLVPDHTADDLRRLMDSFAEASTGPTRQQLAESRAAVAAAQGVAQDKDLSEKLGALRPKLGTRRDIGKSVRKWRKQKGLLESDTQDKTDTNFFRKFSNLIAESEQQVNEVSRRGFLKGLAGFAANASVPAPVVKMLSTPAGVSGLTVAAGLALLKGVQDHLDQFDAEDDDDYIDAQEDMAGQLGFEDDDDEGIYATDQMTDLLDLYSENPNKAAEQLIQHIQSRAIDPADVKASFQSRADDPTDWRYHDRKDSSTAADAASMPTPGLGTTATGIANKAASSTGNAVKQLPKAAAALPAPTKPEFEIPANQKSKVKVPVERDEEGVAEQQVDELSVHKMLKYSDAAEKDRDALNQKWDNRTASEKEKERVLRHEKGEQRAADKIKQKTGKLPVQIGKLDRLKHAITREGVAEGSENLAIGQQMARDGIEYDPAREGEIISIIGDYLKRSGMTPRQVRGYMIDNDFVSDQLSYLPRKSDVSEGIMDVVKQAFNDAVVGHPMGTSDEQFIKSWARDIRDRTGRDIPVEKLAKLYQDYTRRSPDVMQSHGTTNEESAERLSEFAPSDSGDGGGDDDGFDEDTLRKLAAQWFNGDEDPQVERLLAAAGWEIGQDEGYDDEPGVFVVLSGDDDGRSYMSWPAEELRSDVAEARPDVEEGINEDLSPEIKKLNKTYKKLFSIIAYDKNGKKLMSGPKAHKEASRQLGVDPSDMDEYLRLEYYDFFDTVNKEWEKQKGNRKEHYSNEIYGKVDEDPTKIKEARPDVMRHKGDKTVKIVKKGGKPIGEIGIDSEASPGNGPYYVKLYDGSYDAVGFDSAEEALAELKYAIKSAGSGPDTSFGGPSGWTGPVGETSVSEGAGVFNIGDKVLYKGQPAEVSAVDGTAATVYVPNWKAIPGMVDDTTEVDPASKFLAPLEAGVTEQQVNELSPKTLGSYIKKSSADAATRQGEVSGRNQFGKGAEFAVKAFYGDKIQTNPTRTDPRIAKRQAGVDQAVDRLTAEDVAESRDPVEQLRADIQRFAR